MKKTIALDFETPYGKDFSVVDLGYDRYARDPRCVPYLIAVCDGETSWAGEPKDFNFASLDGHNLVSANSAFDEEVSLAADERGLFTVPGLSRWGMNHWFCSSNMTSFLWNVRSLKDGCDIGLGIEISKGVRDRAKDKTMEDMKREGWWEDMLKYGKEDAEHCWKLWDKHNHKWPEFERKLSRYTIDAGRHGVRIDVDSLGKGIDLLNRIIFTAQQNLPWIARGRPPGSPIGIAEECRLVGIPSPPVKAHNPEAAEEWELEYAPKHKFVMALRNLRKAKKTLATLETIKLRIRPDETVAYSLKYAGAGTLRWAGDSGFNLQNMAKEPLLIDADFSFIFDKAAIAPRVKEFSKEHAGERAIGQLKDSTTFFDFRGLIVARPGKMIVAVDEGQIEPRCLNWLAGNHKLLKLISEGLAIYEAHARDSMGWSGGELKTEDAPKYQLSKVRLLGAGYGAGWEKFIVIAQVMGGFDITEGDEDFAKAASVDGKIHQRAKANDKWVYFSTPDDVDVRNWRFPHESHMLLPRENCVFVRKVKKDREGKEVVKTVALPVYGMRSRVTVDEFRKSNPLIVDLWKQMGDALKEAAMRDGDLVVEGPNGYTRTYRDIRRTREKRTDPDTLETYESTRYTFQDGYRRSVIHGPLLVENLCQWVGRNVFAEHTLDLHEALKAEDPTQGVLFTVHDEDVCEINAPTTEEETKARIKQIEGFLSRTPTWMPGLPLKAEAKIKNRYFK